jgi:hypothetical protein
MIAVLTRKTSPFIHTRAGVFDPNSSVFRYGAVVRGQNAYIPPGARRGGQQGSVLPPSGVTKVNNAEVPKVSVNAPDGATVSKSPSPAPANKVCSAPN